MPLQQNKMTPKEIRTKWAIALESGFFKPTSKYLRVLTLGTEYTYTHSPLGVLCAVSQLGEFLPEPTEKPDGTRRQIIKHRFNMYRTGPIPPANAKYGEASFTRPPMQLMTLLGLARYRWTAENFSTMWLFHGRIIPDDLKPELALIEDHSYSINSIMNNSEIPQHRKFPILGRLFRAIDETFASNIK